MSDDTTADPAGEGVGAESVAADQAAAESASPESAPGQPEGVTEEAGAVSAAEALAASLSDSAATETDVTPDEAGASDNQTTDADPLAAVQQELHELKSRYGRERSEMQRLQEQLQAYGGVDPQQLQQMLEQQRQEAELKNLQIWNTRHPDHARFNQLLSRSVEHERLLSGASEEERQALSQRLSREWTADDRQLLQQYYEHQSRVQQELAADPDGYIQARVEEMLSQQLPQYFNQYESWIKAKSDNDQWFNEHQDLIDKHQDDILRVMESPNRRDVALELVRAKAQIAELEQKLGQGAEAVATAEAQQQALNQRSTVQRDAAAQPAAADPVSEARQHGLAGRDLVEFLMERNAG